MSASENTQLSDELESVVADYELTLKGYSFDELNKEKDELRNMRGTRINQGYPRFIKQTNLSL